MRYNFFFRSFEIRAMEKLTLLDSNQFDVYLKSVLFINDRGRNADGDFSESKRKKQQLGIVVKKTKHRIDCGPDFCSRHIFNSQLLIYDLNMDRVYAAIPPTAIFNLPMWPVLG